MHKPYIFLIYIVLAFMVGLSSSCSNSPKCWGGSINKGIIESSVVIACEPVSSILTLIIDNDSIYQETFFNLQSGQFNCTLPVIDFEEHTLLGQFASGQCETKYIREVSQIDEDKRYHYKVIVRSCGTCKKEGYSYNWVTVPKLPAGWTVTFENETE